MKKGKQDYIITVVGMLLLGTGLALLKTIADPKGVMLTLPYICIGVGCGLFGQGIGSILSRRSLKNNPELQKQMAINKNDERNIAITNRAKAKAYDIMTFVLSALMLSFALMGVDLAATLLLVFVFLFIQGYAIYCRCKYENEM